MPYIKKEERKRFDKVLENLPELETKGELEYVVFKLMKMYMKDKPYRYSQLHDVVYAIMHCADEFRRRYLDIREIQAHIKNGDIE